MINRRTLLKSVALVPIGCLGKSLIAPSAPPDLLIWWPFTWYGNLESDTSEIHMGGVNAWEFPDDKNDSVVGQYQFINGPNYLGDMFIEATMIISKPGTPKGVAQFVLTTKHFKMADEEMLSKPDTERYEFSEKIPNKEHLIFRLSMQFNRSKIKIGDTNTIQFTRLALDPRDTYNGSIAIMETGRMGIVRK